MKNKRIALTIRVTNEELGLISMASHLIGAARIKEGAKFLLLHIVTTVIKQEQNKRLNTTEEDKDNG